MPTTVPINLTSSREGPDPSFILAVVGIILCWLCFIIFLGNQGAFHADEGSPPLATLTAFAGPPILFLFAQRNSYIGAQTLKIGPIWVVAAHGLRILGAGFLFVSAFGHLPYVFAFFVGWGDVLVAFLAPFVVARLAFTLSRYDNAMRHWRNVSDQTPTNMMEKA